MKQQVNNQISQNPLVSILVPSLNQGAYLEETFLSIFKQDYDHFEILVADAGSTDHTLEILKKYEATGKVRWNSEKDNGPHSGHNRALRMAKGEIVCFQTSSDTFYPGVIKKIVEEFKKTPELGFLGGAIQVTDQHGFATSETWKLSHPRYEILLEDIVSLKNIPGMPASFLLRSIATKIGGMNEKFYACHSFFFLHYLLEMTRMGFKAVGVNDFFATYREHPNPHNQLASIKGRVHIQQRHQIVREASIEYSDILSGRLVRLMKRHADFFDLSRRISAHRQVIQSLPSLFRALAHGASIREIYFILKPFFIVLLKKLRLVSKSPVLTSPQDTRWYLKNV